MKGCEKWMGRLVKQDLGVSIEMLLGILEIYEDEMADETVTKLRKRFVVICASTFLMLWVGALRGGEVFMLEVSEFVKRRDDGRKNKMGHDVVVPLMGRFKNETGERNLVLVLANETNGGLKVRKWIDRFTALLNLEDQGSSTGPVLCDEARMVLEQNLIKTSFAQPCQLFKRLRRRYQRISSYPRNLIYTVHSDGEKRRERRNRVWMKQQFMKQQFK